jgi:hypothetical protein
VQHLATTDRTLVMSRKAVRVRSSALFWGFAGKTQINGRASVQSRNIYRKLHIFDRTQEVIFALRGVIDVEEREYRPPSEP